jgi:outer membrane protein TolC
MSASLTKSALAVLFPILLAGCVTSAEIAGYSDPRAGFPTVQAKTAEATGKRAVWFKNPAEANAAAERVHALVHKKTIGPDTAVQVALLNNRGLQAAYAEIGLSAADVWQETMPLNPRVAISASQLGIGRTIEGTIASNILAAFTQRRRVDIAAVRFRQAQLQAALETLDLAAETRRAWINAVAAWERVVNLDKAKAAADAASALAKELGESGALPKLEQAREHVFYAELTAEAAKARLQARLAKEELTRLMGLWGQDVDYFVPNALPSLPGGVKKDPTIEAEALRNRIDLQMAKANLEALALSYGLTDATRYLTDLELAGGAEVEREDGEDLTSGIVEASFEIPIFDTGKARMRKAELAYMQAANLLAEKAVNVRSQARSAQERYRSMYQIARHYRDSVLPLRTTIEEQSLLTYNGMITSAFELLADTRARIDSILRSVDAKRAFWLAEVDRRAAIYGGGMAGTEMATSSPAEESGDEGH